MQSKLIFGIIQTCFRILISLGCCLMVLGCCVYLLGLGGEIPSPDPANDAAIMDQFDDLIFEPLKDAESTVRNVPKKFWLSDEAKKGPVPNPENYGVSTDPASLQWLLDEAQTILDGQQTLFTTQTVLMPGTELTYYLDETIFAVTWKQVINDAVFTISEIKVAHPSQFRRHILDSTFDGPLLATPSEMSRAVNAVVGSSADHYRGRRAGIIVYDGEVKRIDRAAHVDVCYVDYNGDLHFSYRGQLMDQDSAQKFVDDHNISFSMAFGPILVDNGVRCEPPAYQLGEVNDRYARAALCQMGPLHYLVVTANIEAGFWNHLDIHQFAEQIAAFGCEKAYTLDGGNTGSIVMNGKLINRTTFGYERLQGDLIYFCTALPDRKE